MLKHPVPKSLLVHIGDVTVSFALLEAQIQFLFGSLINEHQRLIQILSDQLSFDRLLTATTSLYLDRHGEDDDFEKLQELIKLANAIEDERNKITHSIWGAGGNADSVARMKITSRRKSGFQFQTELYDGAKFSSFVVKIKELAFEIQQFTIDLMTKSKAINNPGKKTW